MSEGSFIVGVPKKGKRMLGFLKLKFYKEHLNETNLNENC
jgi:hypothetical protein